jgi:hypothetical protein
VGVVTVDQGAIDIEENCRDRTCGRRSHAKRWAIFGERARQDSNLRPSA